MFIRIYDVFVCVCVCVCVCYKIEKYLGLHKARVLYKQHVNKLHVYLQATRVYKECVR